ncbi:unnamed protein product [Cylindrotheca closterium]|uniref:MIP18 family-like domain-containing protein n=1 Tax=Cylindrotheca closterium TaxID=2856 RepID=A0AAD2FTJ6_9STRA|nr:unnamed protein product [Cylindrotheca closterium]
MAWNEGKAKENANPTILSVLKERSHVGCDWSELGTFEKRNDEWIPTSAEDIAIFKALTDAATATRGRNVNLLENAGISFSNPSLSKKKNIPRFKFSPKSSSEASSSTKDNAAQSKETLRDKISAEEIFDVIRTIQDPEHPNTLEELGVVSLAQVQVFDQSEESSDAMKEGAPKASSVAVRFTPTIPHCSMATLIGLSLTVKLKRSIPPRFKVDVSIEPGTHASEKSVNKQLRDKERICAALENKALVSVVNKCIRNGA